MGVALLKPTPTPTSTPSGPKRGQVCNKGFIQSCPPFPRSTALTARVLASLKLTFLSYGHFPSPDMWVALEAICQTLEAMADGNCEPSIYLSSLDPGVGKTTVIIHFIRALLASEAHCDVATVVCVKRLEQIEAIVKEAKLRNEDFAVLTSDDVMNALGCGRPGQARVLFTTHQMIERRCSSGSFENVSAFHYRGRPRAVRVWDEAILPGQTLTIARDDIPLLLGPLRATLPLLAADLEALFIRLASVECGSSLPVPDFAERHSVSLNQVLGILGKGQNRLVTAAEGLWYLSGRTVSIRRDGVHGNTMLDYRDTLPEDLKPLLALDASGRVRTAYSFWGDRRGGIVMLPSAEKRYDNLTIHVWDHAGGKSAFRRHGDRLVEGIVATVMTKPNQKWLIIHHKAEIGIDVETSVRALLPANGIEVHFLNWGAHDATNRFAHVPNIILAGTLFYRHSHYEALGRLACGQRATDGAFEESDFASIMLGEHRNLLLQATCRGAVRRCEGNGCPSASIYVIASSHSKIAQTLPDIFPGAGVVPWRPVKTVLTGRVAEAMTFLTTNLVERPDRYIAFREVMEHIGWRSAKDFLRRIREHPAFMDALADHGIEEWGKGRRLTGFRLVEDDTAD